MFLYRFYGVINSIVQKNLRILPRGNKKMLKKVLAVSAALVMGAFVFAQATADGGAKPAKAGSVNAVYDFEKDVPAGTKIGTDMMKYKKPTEVAPKARVKGAKFLLEEGEAKWKKESYNALFHNNKPDGSVEKILTNKQWQKAIYSIKIDDAATITLKVAGNGSKEEGRAVVIATKDADGNFQKVAAVDNLSQDVPPVTVTYANAPAGTYYVIGNGHRILGVTAKN